MKTVNIHQAKTHLSRLVEAAAAGEEIIIAKAGKPMARLVPLAQSGVPRVLGALAGTVKETTDWWGPDAELESLFYGPEGEAEPKGKVAERRRRK
jgi:prevent-host-death family protein